MHTNAQMYFLAFGGHFLALGISGSHSAPQAGFSMKEKAFSGAFGKALKLCLRGVYLFG